MTFLYDIGRVLLDFDFETSLTRLLPADGGDHAALQQRRLPMVRDKIPACLLTRSCRSEQLARVA